MKLTIATDDGRTGLIEIDDNDSVENLKALIEVDFSIALERQRLLVNGRELPPNGKLSTAGVADSDIVLVSLQPSTTTSQSAGPSGRASAVAAGGSTGGPNLFSGNDVNAPGAPERLIAEFKDNPQLLAQLEHTNSKLAAAVRMGNVSEVRLLMMQEYMQRAAKQFEEQEELRKLEEDPFNPELQARIAERIRESNVNENLHLAMEEMPEAFGRVLMLYVDVEVNGLPVKAFVDSGAQATIMSVKCAERCGIMRLVDRRYQGQAVGVGTAVIVGRVHMASLKVGNSFYNCTFTILDQDNGPEFLFGLDMLKRHQCLIDLKSNQLCLEGPNGQERVPFLAEHELPAHARHDGAMRESPRSEPVSSSSAASNRGNEATTGSSPSPSASATSSGVQGDTASTSAVAESAVQQLASMGFSIAQATEALQVCNGNLDMAASYLFEQQQA